MTKAQRLVAFGMGAVVLLSIAIQLSLVGSSEGTVATEPVEEVKAALSTCDLGYTNLASAIAGEVGPGAVSRYEAAQRANGLCSSAYLRLRKLPSSPVVDACTEEVSVKRFVATRALRAFEGELTAGSVRDMEAAISEAPGAMAACASALRSAEKAAEKPATGSAD